MTDNTVLYGFRISQYFGIRLTYVSCNKEYLIQK